ncbi:hypothetical protein SEUCBS139899_010248 [Sporothrix eucalyptigena]|uniref:Zn(2)-C6 fungal-type domain-containing protein n=1 Tax=Sporothrix eucalyptigena TaxID=1812306 RepID=A0ABP0BK82_9PEZI
MQLGPYDGRKKRSRCVACAASHLKCSSQQPCSACARRGVTCTYPVARSAAAPVIVESSWTKPARNRQNSTAVARRKTPPTPSFSSSSSSPTSPITTLWISSTDSTSAYYLHHFYAFVRRNDFTGKAAAVQDDLQHLGQLGPATYLRDAMLAIGAMHAANSNPAAMTPTPMSLTTTTTPPRSSGHRAALEYYSAAVSGLSRTLAAASCNMPPDADMRDAVLWTTLFLGFYELMSESPGQGWQLHMVHGTARALRASGAACCRRGRPRTFFLQARVFEVFRAIVCSDATFLTEPEWTNLLEEMWVGDFGSADGSSPSDKEAHPWHPLDALLDLIVLCTKLRFRIRVFLAQCHNGQLTEDTVQAEGQAIGNTARSLRKALERWRTDYGHIGVPSTPAFSSSDTFVSSPTASSLPSSIPITTDPSMILGHIFCAAANAYLSGIFDYELDQWDAIGITPPTLPVEDLQHHVDTILRYAAPALATTNIAPILLLFPLRIAGARSRYPRQRVEVLRLLGEVGRMYAAAIYYSAHLQRLWGRLEEEEEIMAKARAEAKEARARGRLYIKEGIPTVVEART